MNLGIIDDRFDREKSEVILARVSLTNQVLRIFIENNRKLFLYTL